MNLTTHKTTGAYATPHGRRARFVFLVHGAQSEDLFAGAGLFRERYGALIEVDAIYVRDLEEEAVSFSDACARLAAADVALLDVRGGGAAARAAQAALAEGVQPVAALVGGSMDVMRLTRLGRFSFAKMGPKPGGKSAAPAREFNVRRMQRMLGLANRVLALAPFGRFKDARAWLRLMEYWRHNGPENICRLLAFLGRAYAGLDLPKAPPPEARPPCGIYDLFTDTLYASLAAYRRACPPKPGAATVGLLFYGGLHFGQSAVPARAAAQCLRDVHGLDVLPVFAEAGHNIEAIERFFVEHGRSAVDAVIYFEWFQLTTFAEDEAQAAGRLLETLDVPVFNGAPMFGREIAKWRAAPEGFSPIETMTAVILPELDGMIEPIPTAGLASETLPHGAIVKKTRAIPDRIARRCARTANWTRLRRLANRDKRVALIVYNNPPGEESLGGAAYLDVFASVSRLLETLREQGYGVDNLPKDKPLQDLLVDAGLLNEPRWRHEDAPRTQGYAATLEDYAQWREAFPADNGVEPVWGPAPGAVMTLAEGFAIPAVAFGNVLLGVQPARSLDADVDAAAHDRAVPPHHQYAAFYRWLETQWKPDAVVHIGTHGTLEFLQGKEAGLTAGCWPDVLLGDVPHLYFYHVVNASEAVIAKRRSYAALINYSSPSFVVSELYEAYAALEARIAELLEARTLDPGRAARLEAHILEDAAGQHLAADSVEAVQEELALMKRSLIPKGLHTLGDGFCDGARVDFAAFVARYDRAQCRSLNGLLAQERGLDYDALLRGEAPEALAEVDATAHELVRRAYVDGQWPRDPAQRAAAAFAVEAARNLDGRGELDALVRALDGRYIKPGLGADPVRNPEALPTGRNSFQFHPGLIPSDEACQRGAEIAENTLAHYVALHGRPPRSVAVVLWGFETAKTRGETVGQVLAYLGVRIVPGRNPWHKELEVVSAAELGRPRVDCHIQICGFFRDMFANVMSLLDRAFELVADLDEADDVNPVRANTAALRDRLREAVGERDADQLALGRIFGPPPGEYGTRLTRMIEHGAWSDEAEIADAFAQSMRHVYRGQRRGQACPEAFEERVRGVELVSQVRDTHEYEVGELDHYYEFFGGLSRTVEEVRGAAPEMLISDTTKERIRTERVGDAINRGVRTRLLNPKWIDPLLEHDFHGAQKIADRVEFLVGFAATTHAVDNWVWSDVTARYVADKELFDRLCANNRFAGENMLKRLFEAERRGYWRAAPEEMDLLRQRYLEIEAALEDGGENR